MFHNLRRHTGFTARTYLALLSFMLLANAAAQAEMQIEFRPAVELNQADGHLILPLREGGKIRDEGEQLGPDLLNAFNAALTSAEFKGEAGSSLTLYNHGNWSRVTIIGLASEALTVSHLREFGGSTAKAGAGQERIAVYWPSLPSENDTPAAHIALGAALGSYRFAGYQKPPKKPAAETVLTLYSSNAMVESKEYQNQWQPVADAVHMARDLINEPANIIYPQSFVTRIQSAFEAIDNVKIKVLDENDIEKQGMLTLLGVGQGSARPPRLLVIEYNGGNSNQDPLVWLGKGVTFDTGGISIKNSKGMWEMKYDMAGAATVSAATLAIAARGAPVNIVAIAPLVENMPSAQAQRPGDVRMTLCGESMEVIDTDAEGRLILADALCYAEQNYQPQQLLDVATLTGAALYALGNSYAALFTEDDALAEQFMAAGHASGEPLWRLPLHEDYAAGLKSDIADIKNFSDSPFAGASTGAHVIGHFARDDSPWVHLDIAGVAWEKGGTATTPRGAAGWGVLLLDQLVRDSYE